MNKYLEKIASTLHKIHTAYEVKERYDEHKIHAGLKRLKARRRPKHRPDTLKDLEDQFPG